MCLGPALWQSSRLCTADNERGRSLRLDKCRGNAPRRCPPDSIPPSPEEPLLCWSQSEPSVPPHAALAWPRLLSRRPKGLKPERLELGGRQRDTRDGVNPALRESLPSPFDDRNGDTGLPQ